MEKKRYAVGCTAPEDWQYIHELLIQDGTLDDNIPSDAITVDDVKEHSPTRAVYLLTEEEAALVEAHEKVSYCHEAREDYSPPALELQAAVQDFRYVGVTTHYRAWQPYGLLPTTGGTGDYKTMGRSGFQLYRHSQKQDPWVFSNGNNANSAATIFNNRIPKFSTGKDVDVIVADEGFWLGHIEFYNPSDVADINKNTVNPDGDSYIFGPEDMIEGNVLNPNGRCYALDLIVDAPYYIDPDFFNASLDAYWNGPIVNVVGDGSDFFKRELTVNGVRIMGAGTVGGQTAVPDAWLEKVGRMFELFTDPSGPAGVATVGINTTFQRELINTLSGNVGTYHSGFKTIQRVARGAGADYSTNFLTDEGVTFWNLTNLYDTHVQNDMVWYLNSTGDGYGDGDLDAQEVIEHVFHTIHMHGLPAEDIKLYPFLAPDWADGDLYAAMEEAYDAGKWDPSGYQPPGSPDEWKTDGDAYEVAAKEYLYLLNFCMFEYTSLWDGGSLSPEWTDDMRTQVGIQSNNPLGYSFFNTWMAPIITKPSLTTIRSIFQDGNTPDQDDPSQSGSSGYVVDDNGRTETRWDGTVVPVSSVAVNWWRNNSTTYRSVGFTTFGTALVSTLYNRNDSNGSNTSTAYNSTHGTQCAAATFGRTQGWAYNANKWVLNLYGSRSSGIEAGFDAQKLFHQMKPNNPELGTKDPTISSNSWGYRAVPSDNAYYYYRGASGVSYSSSSSRSPFSSLNTKPGFMRWVGYYGDGYRMKGEHPPNSTTQALDELINAGVIFVGAAGNSGQKQVSSDHPDFDNYWNTGLGVTVGQNFFYEFGVRAFPYTNRRGFPQQGGMTRTGVGGTIYTYPVINIGALDDEYSSAQGYKERKVTYSDMGSEIDCYAAADGILTALNVSSSGYTRHDSVPSGQSGFTYYYDNKFSGTSAACPVACGLIATKLENNRDWGWQDVKNWLRGHNQPVGVTTLQVQDSTDFHYGQDTAVSGAGDISGGPWSDVNSLEGSTPIIIYDAETGNESAPQQPAVVIAGRKMFEGGGMSVTGNFTISYE